MKMIISKSGVVTKPFLELVSLIEGDLVAQEAGAICTIMAQNMDFTGAVNEQIAAACGYDLDAFILENIYKPRVGEVYALPGGDLAARHIFLGILPHFRTEFDMNDSHLSGVVRAMMDLSRCMLLSSIAFPPLGIDPGGYAKARAARLLVQGIADRMHEGLEEVRIVAPDAEMVGVFREKLG